jgi:3-hydroxyacyl-CoA dehydrogenase
MPDVDYRLDRGVAVVSFANPPVNGLSHAVRFGIAQSIARAQGDPAVAAIVLAGGGGLFSGGADIREFGTPASLAEPRLRQLIDQIEGSDKPVVAAISGTCLGGGLELAMAAHYRVASAEAKLGLPEVKLGLLPGAGGTQRLPRLVGAARAIQMIVTGDAVPAAALAGARLLDRVVDGDPVAAAVALAGSGGVTTPPPRARDLSLDEPNLAALCAEARTRASQELPPLPAPLRAIEVIEAGAESFDRGLELERQAFVELMASPESKGLRHAFLAERAAAKVEGIGPGTPIRPLDQAAVIGAGTMGAGIASALLDAGIPTWLLETDQPALDSGTARVAAIYDGQVRTAKLSPVERDRRVSLLRPTLSYDDIGQADVVIEAVFESLKVKRDVFTALDGAMKPGAILATNSSTLDVDAIAAFTRRPSDVLGLHFIGPAHVMRLLEVVRGQATAAEVLATALRLGKLLRKVTVVTGVCDGLIGNRMLDAYVRQAWSLVEEGAAPEQVDRAIEAFGFAMGPFRAAAAELVASPRMELGLTPRVVDDGEIVDRLVYALVNEGARVLDEGIAARASDIDVVHLTGYGFPRSRGGPMFYAEQVGLDRVLARVRQFARNPHGDPAFWAPAPLLERLGESGGTFAEARPAAGPVPASPL